MAMLTTRQPLTPTWHACPPDGHDDPRKPSQMSIDSHGFYSLEPASPVYRVIQAQMSFWQSGFIPGTTTCQSKDSFG
jgi:hypothetical protein